MDHREKYWSTSSFSLFENRFGQQQKRKDMSERKKTTNKSKFKITVNV